MAREEQIRSSIDSVDSEILKDMLSILLSKDDSISSPSAAHMNTSPTYKNFAQAIMDLKRNYKFSELNAFTTEADLVYVQAGDRRILLTEKNVEPVNTQNTVQHNSPAVSDSQKESDNSEDDSMDNAFENIKPNDNRFSHLEF